MLSPKWIHFGDLEMLFASLSSAKSVFALTSFPIQLALVGAVLVLSIVVDRYALKIGIPGALALFGIGVALQPTSSLGYEHKFFEDLHVIALCLLLFYSGVKLCRRYFHRKDFLVSSLLLSIVGIFIFVAIGSLVMFAALSLIYGEFRSSGQPLLVAMALAYCMAPQDWGAFTFVVKRVERFSDRILGVLEFETAVSAAMTLVTGEVLFAFFSKRAADEMAFKVVDVFFGGIFLGLCIGVVLGYALAVVIRRFAVERSQTIDLAIGFVLIGYGLNTLLGQGGLICSLVMGFVVSVLLSHQETEDEKEMLSIQLESINIASESLIFFMAGLAVDLSVGVLQTLLAALVLLMIVWIIRPLTVGLFFRRNPFLSPREFQFLSLWAPKGAISMALAITIPDLIEESGMRFETVINPVSESFIVDAVCFAVVFSMLIKSLILPVLHKRLIESVPAS